MHRGHRENTALENRVEALEQEMRLIKSLFHELKQEEKPWWVSQAGAFKDDPLFDEMVEAAQQYRKSQVETDRGMV